MRRIVFTSIIGLGLAFGVFYALSWPATIQGTVGRRVTIEQASVNGLIYVGLGRFRVIGPRDATVVTVKLQDPSVAIVLEATRVALVSSNAPLVGVERGPQPAVDALPKAPGYVLHPQDIGVFVVSFRAVSAGTFTFHGFILTYQTGWLTRTVHLGPTVTVQAA